VAGYVAYSHAIYGVTKAAVIQLTKTMAVSLAPDVRVNCYCPGTIDTAMNKNTAAAGTSDPRVAKMTAANLLRRKGTADEVAKLACYLASSDAGFITGSAYLIDGGTLAWRGSHE
jgi:NAD(P)-dependent dehydrogenase (short-subunit alcohol dehydrogenase family)